MKSQTESSPLWWVHSWDSHFLCLLLLDYVHIVFSHKEFKVIRNVWFAWAPQVPQKVCAYPTIVYTGEHPASSEAMHVSCEDMKIDVLDVTSGVSLLMSMYWAFNIEYAPSVKQTLTVIEHMMDLKHTKPLSSAIQLITVLRARQK